MTGHFGRTQTFSLGQLLPFPPYFHFYPSPLPIQLGVWERCELDQQSPGGALAANAFSGYFEARIGREHDSFFNPDQPA